MAPKEKSSRAKAPPQQINGAEALMRTLEKEGVEVIFGYPGGVLLEIYDKILNTKIHHILVRHEQAAIHAADGYARVTGRPGVCLVTSGPGATNIVTGLANAHMDSVPIVAITGQVSTSAIGKDAFQEADITGITMPITKHNFLVKDPNDIARVIREAFYIAGTGRPGPVLVDIPKDVTMTKIDYEYPKEIDIPGYKPTLKGHPKQIEAALKLIAQAKRPVIIAGGGVVRSHAYQELFKFVEACQIPIATTLHGMGIFPLKHPLCLGLPGMHGGAYANYAIHEADLIVGIGIRFDDRVTGKLSEFAKYAKVIHVDIDPAEISKVVPAAVPIVGDVKHVLREMIPQVKKPDHGDWLKKIEAWKKQYPISYKPPTKLSKPQFVIQEIDRITKGDAIFSTDVGQHQMWSCQFMKNLKPGQWISSGGLGTMGYGFPSAIGAQIAFRDKTVVAIVGDGSFQMTLYELGTLIAYNLPVKIFIINNGFLGMVRQWQQLFYENRHSSVDMEPGQPDFVKLADAYGILGLRTHKDEEVASTIERALKHKGAVLVDFQVDREESVFPMVPAGGELNKMLFEDIEG